MHVESSTTPIEATGERWISVHRVPEKNSKTTSQFFYIGKTDEAIQALSICFASGTVVDSFAEARKLIDKAGSDLQTDVIFIDLPLRKNELDLFCLYLKERNLLAHTPVIYNE